MASGIESRSRGQNEAGVCLPRDRLLGRPLHLDEDAADLWEWLADVGLYAVDGGVDLLGRRLEP